MATSIFLIIKIHQLKNKLNEEIIYITSLEDELDFLEKEIEYIAAEQGKIEAQNNFMIH